MGIKKAQAPSHTLYQACDSPKYTMVEICAMVRSSKVYLVLLIKSLSRSQFGREIEQQKVMSLCKDVCQGRRKPSAESSLFAETQPVLA